MPFRSPIDRFGFEAAFACIGNDIDNRKFGMALVVECVRFLLPETIGEGHVLGGRDDLVSQQQDLVLQDCRLYLRHEFGRWRPGEVRAKHLCAQGV